MLGRDVTVMVDCVKTNSFLSFPWVLWGSLPSCLNVLQELSRTGASLVKRLAKHDVYFESISVELHWNPSFKTSLKIGLLCEVHVCGSVKEGFEGKWS